MAALFRRPLAPDDALFAEALSLVEDGLDVDFVLGLYPTEAAWLGPQLRAASSVIDAHAEAQPSYFFEGSLKSRFLAVARDRAQAPTAEPVSWLGMVRGTAAAMTMVAGAALLGVVALGFITAEQSVPGDWNYAFKLANERFQYTTSRGQERIDLQIQFTQNRVQEIEQKIASGDDVSASDLAKVEAEARELATRLRDQPLDEASQVKLTELGQTTEVVLNAVRLRGPELAPSVDSAIESVTDAVAVGTGGTAGLATPTATPSTPEPTAEPTIEPTPTATPEPPAPTQSPDDATVEANSAVEGTGTGNTP